MNNYQTSILVHSKFRLARLLNSFQYGCQFNVIGLSKKQQTSKKARNQGFFRAGEFSWNQGTSINDLLQQEKERSRREKSSVFSPGTLKNCTLNKKVNPQLTTIRVFPKIRTVFSYFQKRGGVNSFSPPSSYAPAKYGSDNHKTFAHSYCEIRVIHHWLIFLTSPCFQHFSSYFCK